VARRLARVIIGRQKWRGTSALKDNLDTTAHRPDVENAPSSPECGSDTDSATEHDPQHAGPDGLTAHDPAREPARRTIETWSRKLRVALIASMLIVAVLGGLTGYLGYRTYETRVTSDQRELFLQAGREAAINLTTISYTRADADVARILDSATGTFHDDFQNRAQPFIDVVKKAQSVSEGNVTSVGLESIDGDRAQVIVAISVKTTNAGVAEQQPRGWRMRLNLQRIGDIAKVFDVHFVP
jgi:Mce-associated membrane protein